ncbi:MAG: TIGR00282 family metallophosphoesterase [Bryobacteraceae bacterium]|nr:TIGR00282 family metallophosphoesterase [Bryobacteraceae bacterium]MDW8377126.1 TIGR00282 family metallophosphoesterase [Bryobacterales bacterium]
MRILFIGDIFASPGRKMVADHLAGIVEREHIDLVIANAENAAGGFGLTPALADELFALHIDVLTSGNHIWDKREIYDYFSKQPRLIRPANYGEDLPGKGLVVVPARNGVPCAVINLQGRSYMPMTDCPFRKADSLLASLDPSIKIKIVDFHAELTSEKTAMGWYLDGRVTAVIGTHTHIPTADSRILNQGTAYQTDAGMTGPYESIIGVDRESVIRKFLTALPVRFESATGQPELHGVILDADPETGRALHIQRLAVGAK